MQVVEEPEQALLLLAGPIDWEVGVAQELLQDPAVLAHGSFLDLQMIIRQWTYGLRTSLASRKPRFTSSSLASKPRSSCSMMMGPS